MRASDFGILDLSGNLWERTITLANATGRSFNVGQGNGSLDLSGNANVASWPGTNADGADFRGGRWYADPANRFVPDRFLRRLW